MSTYKNNETKQKKDEQLSGPCTNGMRVDEITAWMGEILSIEAFIFTVVTC